MKNNLKKYLLLSIALLLGVMLPAQTQYGYVKTKGRMVDGQVIHGQGLKGAMVSIKGRTTVVANGNNGDFFFPVPKDKKYHIDSVRKADYELVDYSILRTHTYSGDTIYITMEKPAQQQADLLEKERKLRRSSEEKLQKLEDSIMNLNISLDEKSRQLDAISKQREFNENYIKELAKYYATLDYDRISEFQRQINAFLEEGDYEKAIQLIHSNGNLSALCNKIQENNTIIAKTQAEIKKGIEDIENIQSVNAKLIEETEPLLFSCFQSHLMLHHYDSAAYYIEYRANLDSTNAKWQYDAAQFFQTQNNFDRTEFYYLRALNDYRNMGDDDITAYGVDMCATLNNLANYYFDFSRTNESEDLYLEALDICEELSERHNTEVCPIQLLVLSNLGRIYASTQRYEEGLEYYLKGNELYQTVQYDSLLMRDPAMIHALLACVQGTWSVAQKIQYISPEKAGQVLENGANNGFSMEKVIQIVDIEDMAAFGNIFLPMIKLFSDLYMANLQYQKCDTLLNKAVEISRLLVKENPEANTATLVQSLEDLATYYSQMGRFPECKPLYDEALEMSRQLVETNAQVFTPLLLNVLINLGDLYGSFYSLNPNEDDLKESEAYLLEALEIARLLANTYLERHEENLCRVLNSLGNLYQLSGKIKQDSDYLMRSEKLFLEEIEIERRLSQSDPEFQEQYYASSLNSLGNLYYDIAMQSQDKEMFRKSEKQFLESLEIGRSIAEDNPDLFEPGLAGSLATLGNLYRDMGEYSQCEPYYDEAIEIWHRLAKDNNGFELNLAEALTGAAQCYGMQQKYKEAIKLAEEAYTILKPYKDQGTDIYGLFLNVSSILATLYTSNNDLTKAENAYNELIPMVKALYLEDMETWRDQYAIELGSASYCYILNKQFAKAEQYATDALTIDISQQWVFTNLAAAYLLQGKYEEAEEIYRNMKDTLKTELLDDIQVFEKNHIIPKERKEDVKRIKRLLNE